MNQQIHSFLVYIFKWQLTLTIKFAKLPPMNIMIDLDKVVFDCNSIAYNFANRYFTTSTINRKLRYKIVDAEIARHYKNKLSFLKFCNTEHLTPVDNSVKIIKKWKNEGHSIHFVSTRPYIKSFQKMTLDWFDKNNINFDS